MKLANEKLARLYAQADGQLRQLEESFRATFEQAAVGIAHVSLDGRWLQANQKLCEITGYSREALFCRTFQDITFPEDLDADLELLQQVLSGEIQTYNIEKRYIHSAGHLVWINLTVSLVRDVNGGPDYFISVVENIQQRKEAELALKASKAALVEAQHLAGVGNWKWDIRTDVRTWSDEVYRIYGREPAPVVFAELPTYFTKESWTRLWAAVDKCRTEGVPYECDVEVVRPDGTHRWIVARGKATRDLGGAIVEVNGTVQDITERKHLEERLRQQAMVFNSAEEGIVITDSKSCVIDANPAFERFTEYTLDEMRGKNLRFLQSGRHDRSFYLTMWNSILQNGSWQGEIWNRRKSGDIYLEWVSITAVPNSMGSANYVGISIDLSRMRHAQSELERMAHHDGLTNLPNRLLLLSRLEHAVERVKRHGGSGAVLFIDLDHFKPVNDTLGHKAGDELLQGVASRIKSRLREFDTLARLGGDEFVIVLEEIPEAGAAAAVALEVIRQLQMPFALTCGNVVNIGCSIGIAIFPQDGDVAAQLIERADQALYDAKGTGRGVYRFFENPAGTAQAGVAQQMKMP